MKRQIWACAWVAAALLLMFKWATVVGWGAKVHAELSSGGLRVTYYRGADFSSVVCQRTERKVQRDYGERPPAWRVPRSGYSARWTGVLLVPATALYTFNLRSDDGSRLLIDDRMVIDSWEKHSLARGTQAEIRLAQGRHSIRIEHCNRSGAGAIRLDWTGGPVPAKTVLAVPFLEKD